MKLKPALLCLALISTVSLIRAEEPKSVTIEPRAPASYTETDPAYLYFKKIVITRKAKSIYDFDIELQGDIPSGSAKGLQYLVYFDFADLVSTDPSLKRGGDNFTRDMMIQLYRGPQERNFTFNDTEMLQDTHSNRLYEIKLTNLAVRKNKFSFSARSPIFAEDKVTRVVFNAAILEKSKTGHWLTDNGHMTKPTGLNEESNAALTAKPTPAPAASPSPAEAATPPTLNSLIKP